MPRAAQLARDRSADGAIAVIVGIVIDDRDHVLVAQRPEGKHMAGSWEFPGGKLLPGESAFAGLRRELAEELGIRVAAAEPLVERRFSYPDRTVHLDVWWVLEYSGEATALEGQALRWVEASSLSELAMLPADAPIVAAVRARLG
jgi:8-oxo-dGTP diphosphatase